MRDEWQPKQEARTSGDFTALLAQLDHPDGAAPLDDGLIRLLSEIEAIRRGPGRYR